MLLVVMLTSSIVMLFLLSFSSHVSISVEAVNSQQWTESPPAVANGMFWCTAEERINSTLLCNGISECSNGLDEKIQTCGCHEKEFLCNATVCINILRRCDTKSDCADGRDELDCESYTCPRSMHTCDNHLCVPLKSLCDFKNDCGDNSDEKNCKPRDCYSTDCQCDNQQCIACGLLCDGVADCTDSSDELHCDRHFKCENSLYIAMKFRCDGWVDCIDSQTDEQHCRECTKLEYTCKNTRCVPRSNVCDGHCDCGDCDDEADCDEHVPCVDPDDFICKSYHNHRRCIQKDYVCDGHNDCLSDELGLDETFCANTNSSALASKQNCSLTCNNKCLDKSAICDGIADCPGAVDEDVCGTKDSQIVRLKEAANCSLEGFLCMSKQCVPRTALCDAQTDCNDLSDEINCFDFVCPEGSTKCSKSGQCYSASKRCNWVKDCFDGSDELGCGYPEVCGSDQFRCRSGQCIDAKDVCIADDDHGCKDNSHLLDCRNVSCREGYYKCRNSYCIHASRVCDGRIDCKAIHSDEEGKDCKYPCPMDHKVCMCLDVSMDCDSQQLTSVPDMSEEKGISNFYFRNNLLGQSLKEDSFDSLLHAKYLDLTQNHIEHIPPFVFRYMYLLTTLNLANNNIRVLLNDTFDGLFNLAALYLDGNMIETIHPYAFRSLLQLKALNLSHQALTIIRKHAFYGLRRINMLNLSHNRIEIIEDGAFNMLTLLKVLDISGNRITSIEGNLFNGLALTKLYTDEYRFCCVAHTAKECFPKPNAFSSCADLMSNIFLRASIWSLGVLSVIGNTVVIIWRFFDTKDSRVHSFLITNLAIGDLVMGIYLMIIAGADLYYRGDYIVYDQRWRLSGLCQFAGFLSTFSCEFSVLTLTVITLDRLVSITLPLRFKRMTMKEARIILALLWVASVILAGVPLLRIDYFNKYYARSGVCLALHITPDQPPGWEYSVFVFIVINFACCVVIGSSYLRMFIAARQSRAAVRASSAKKEREMAQRMCSIVMTDFACWVPIIILGIMSLAGIRIPPQVFAWVAVFVLPLNAAINPVLYTLSTTSFASHVARRFLVLRRSFHNNVPSMETQSSLLDEEQQLMQVLQPTLSYGQQHRRRVYTFSGQRNNSLDAKLPPSTVMTSNGHRAAARLNALAKRGSEGRCQPTDGETDSNSPNACSSSLVLNLRSTGLDRDRFGSAGQLCYTAAK